MNRRGRREAGDGGTEPRKVVIDAPRLPKQLEQNARLESREIDNDEPYLAFEVTGGALRGDGVRYASFRQGRFVDVDFSDSHLVAPEFTDVRFERCNLANARWEEMAGRRVELIGCRLTGFVCSDAKIQHLLARDCTMELANFRFSACSPARFEQCQMMESDFLGADLARAVVRDCDLSRAELTRAKLNEADLRGSRLDGAKLGEAEMQGTWIDLTQVVTFAEYLGLRVDLGWAGER